MFITFEGIEGSGKSTALSLLAEYLEGKGHAVQRTREPGGTALGRTLRALVLDVRASAQGLCSAAELCIFLADRAQHVNEVIRPCLNAGQIVLCDRYVDSTLCYQGHGRGMDVKHIKAVNELAIDGLWPHLTLLLDLPVEAGLRRAGRRNIEDGTAQTEGRFEAESVAFHERVRQGYLALAAQNPQRFVRIDASLPPDEVFLQCIAAVEKQQAL